MDDRSSLSASAETLSAALAPAYEIIRPLGAGSMGSVHLARDPALRRLVAIKVPLPELARDATVRQRFEREARAAARITHPNAVGIHAIARLPDGTPYIVMEYVDGRTLAQTLEAEGALPLPLAVDILYQVAVALEAAHRHGVIHRDVRPGNVLWQPDERRAVLSDFGIAGILETGTETITRLTTENQQLGDPGHMSPEQLVGDPVTEAADVYSFGVLVFEVLTLQRPFRAERAADVSMEQLRRPPRDLADALPGVDPRLRDLVKHCLARDPRLRPTAPSVVRTLARVRADHSGAAAAAGDSHSPQGRTGTPNPFADAVEGLPALSTFISELRRRRVFNVAIVYVAAAGFLLQLAQAVLPVLPLPGWVYTVLVALALSGFPVVLVLAWVYDVTTTGIRRTESAPASHSTQFRLLQAAALAFTLALAGLLGWWILRQ